MQASLFIIGYFVLGYFGLVVLMPPKGDSPFDHTIEKLFEISFLISFLSLMAFVFGDSPYKKTFVVPLSLILTAIFGGLPHMVLQVSVNYFKKDVSIKFKKILLYYSIFFTVIYMYTVNHVNPNSYVKFFNWLNNQNF